MQVHWINKKGAGCMRAFSDYEKCAEFLSNLRAEASVSHNGQIIGGVERAEDRADDKRIKWLWWIERSETHHHSLRSPVLDEDWQHLV